jgi:glyoxylase-like metal-dependent hydrolase (beta-lactamase superfamily II)
VATDILLEWLQKDFGIKEVTAIVTGFHQDNLGGIESLLQKGAQVWGMTLTDSLLCRDSASFKREIMESVRNHGDKKYYNRYSKIIFRTPNQLVNLHAGESKSIEIDGLTFEIFYPGPSHTADNSVVYLPDQKLLFGGCMIRAKSSRQPGNVAYADMDKWPWSVEKVLEKYRHAAIVVPGHGLAGDISLIDHTIKILNEWNANHVVE